MTAPSPDKPLAAHYDASVGMALVCAHGSEAGRFVRVSRALVEMLGHPEEALLEMTVPAVTHPDDVELDSEQLRGLTAGEVSSYEIEKRLLRADGEIVSTQLHASLVRAPDGSPLYTVMQVVDVTALMRNAALRDLREVRGARQALAQSERRFRIIAEATSDGIWAIDAESRATFLNRRASEMLGYERQELIGRSLLELLDVPSRAAVAETLERIAGDGEEECSATFVHKDGRSVQVLISATPLLDDDGTHAGSLAMVTDITAGLRAERERAELEARLRQAERLETVGQLAGGVAHDFNNLLSVIEGYAGYVADEVADRPGASEGIEEIRRAAERGARLTRRLLMFSRRDRVNPETVDLRRVVTELRPLLEGTVADHSTLSIETPDEPVRVTIDVQQFEQLLLNLAVNARDAMPGGGLLTIELRRLDDGRVQMKVSDTGAGMRPEVAERAFEPFYTTKPTGEGSGLGLAAVYGIVTQSGGEVRLESAPGDGTRVVVELPRAVDEAGEIEAPRETRAARGETILLVEDEDAVRAMAARILRRHGYEVIEASGAEEALGAYRALDHPPALVLTDVAMPRMSGVELAARLGKSSPPVMFMSGYTDESVGNADVAAHGAGFLPKPFSPTALLHRVGEALSGASTRLGRVRSD